MDRLLQQVLLLECLTQTEVEAVDPPLEFGKRRVSLEFCAQPVRLAELADQLVDRLRKQPQIAIAGGLGLDVVEALIEALDFVGNTLDRGRRGGGPLAELAELELDVAQSLAVTPLAELE